MHTSLSPALAATALAATMIPGVPVATAPDTVRWGPCPEEVASPRPECSTLEVPLDYRDPDGRQNDAVTEFLTTGQCPAQDLARATEPSE
ncbi:hypothetical protein ACWZEH_09015 [Streptomyces sp. QTS137]